jgi:HAD superfamily hydrolase (TIGR01509 family)
MSLDINRIKILCFDIDGTLRNTDDQYVAFVEKFFRPIRFLFPHNDVRRFSRKLVMRLETPANKVISLPDKLGIDNKLAGVDNWLHERGVLKVNRNYEIIHGVHETLRKLSPHYHLAIVTARGQRETLAFMECFSLMDQFEYIASALTCQRSKPHPDQILWIASQVGLPPEACLMIGDTTVDILAGIKAGAQTIGVLSGFGEKEELLNMGADMILKSVVDLPEIILRNTV